MASSALVRDLLEKADKTLEDKGEGWVERLTAHAVERSQDRAVPEEVRPVVFEAARKIRDNAPAFVKLGRIGLGRVGAYLLDDDEEGAYLAWLQHTATFRERVDAQRAAAVEVIAARAEQDATWNTVRKVLEEIGKGALQVLVKVAVGAIKL